MRWKIFQWMKFLFRHSSNSRKLSRQKFQNELACVFTAHCRLKSTTTNRWRHFGQSEQRKSSVLFPIQSEKSPDSGFFTCDPTKKCIMPSSRERHKGIIGRGHDLRLVWQLLFNIVRTLQTTALKSQKFLHESSYDGFSGTDNGEQSLNKSASVFHLWLLEAFSWFQFTRSYLFQIALEIMWLPIQIALIQYSGRSEYAWAFS